jgi:hypothetical protein
MDIMHLDPITGETQNQVAFAQGGPDDRESRSIPWDAKCSSASPLTEGIRPTATVHAAICSDRFTSIRVSSTATNVHNPPQPCGASIDWYSDVVSWYRTVAGQAQHRFMPKRGTDAYSRVFFDELSSLTASRLKATGAIRIEDRQGVIAFGDEDHGGERRKCIGVTHTKFPNGGSWSYFICPRCGGKKKKLWLVDDAPRCLSCCRSLGIRYRSAYGFGRSERLRERDRYADRVQGRRLRGRKRRLTMTMRRSMIVCRLALLAHQQKAKDGSDEPLSFMRSYQPRKAAIEAIPDLKRLWKAQTTEALEQALDRAQRAIIDALQSDDIRTRIIAARLMLKTRAARQRGWT